FTSIIRRDQCDICLFRGGFCTGLHLLAEQGKWAREGSHQTYACLPDRRLARDNQRNNCCHKSDCTRHLIRSPLLAGLVKAGDLLRNQLDDRRLVVASTTTISRRISENRIADRAS